jgi:hypothetical protein
MKRASLVLAALAALILLVPAGAAYACGSDSDCKVGHCSSGKCGSCGSDSDCKGGTCSGGKCSNRDDYTKG